jgi:hypothetical protein
MAYRFVVFNGTTVDPSYHPARPLRGRRRSDP